MYDDLISFIRDWYETRDYIPLHEPRFREADKQFVADAIDSTFVSSVGEYVDRFEKELARYLGARFAVVTVNGTCALQVALNLAGAGRDDEVITQPLSFVATANAIAYNNSLPVFIDVNKETFGLCPDALEKFLDKYAEKRSEGVYNKKTKRRIAAIVPMHTFGHPAGMKKIIDVAGGWGIPVVEDAAEALGSTYLSKQCATLGKLGILSFNGNKIITCGGGGAIITDDKNLAKKAKHITTTAKIPHKWEFFHDEVGYNYRMPNLNAALACAQLGRLDGMLKDKRKLSESYSRFFEKEEWGRFVTEPDGCRSNYWLNAVILPNRNQRDAFLESTNNVGVMTRPIWHLLCDLPMYKDCQKDELKDARWLCDRVVNLPSSARKNVE